MRVSSRQNVMKDLTVKEAMRRLIINLAAEATLEEAIRYAIKYKVNAILITDSHQEAVGVVTKTDLMGAYYAGLPLDTPAASIMVGPPLFCHLDDSLDAALDRMRTHKIHRLYVQEAAAPQAVGVLAYPDIVGLLYRYCHQCDKNLRRNTERFGAPPGRPGAPSGSDDPGGLCPEGRRQPAPGDGRAGGP